MECRLQKLTVSMTPGTTALIHSMLLPVFGQFSNAQPRLWHSVHGQVTGTFPNKTRLQSTITQTGKQSERKISTRVLKWPATSHTRFMTAKGNVVAGSVTLHGLAWLNSASKRTLEVGVYHQVGENCFDFVSLQTCTQQFHFLRRLGIMKMAINTDATFEEKVALALHIEMMKRMRMTMTHGPQPGRRKK